jgi:UDP-2-acetamido-3-amino-2,3-dideoxy-glucuronate N-acetyltransferase
MGCTEIINYHMEPKGYFIHKSSVADEGCHIGEGTNIWHFCHVMAGARIGKECTIGQNVMVATDVVLGDRVKVQNNVSIYTGVTLEDEVFLGPSCVFTNVLHPRSGVNRKGQFTRTNVGKGATIGANATVVCGHDIGKYAFIGAGAVVTKKVPDYALVMGNPAIQKGWVSEFGQTLAFDWNGMATCPESGQEYKLENNQVTRIK